MLQKKYFQPPLFPYSIKPAESAADIIDRARKENKRHITISMPDVSMSKHDDAIGFRPCALVRLFLTCDVVRDAGTVSPLQTRPLGLVLRERVATQRRSDNQKDTEE